MFFCYTYGSVLERGIRQKSREGVGRSRQCGALVRGRRANECGMNAVADAHRQNVHFIVVNANKDAMKYRCLFSVFGGLPWP